MLGGAAGQKRREAQVRGELDRAGVGFQIATEEFEQRRFAAPIGAQDAQLHAGRENEIELVNEQAGVAGLAHGFDEAVRKYCQEFFGLAVPVAAKSIPAAWSAPVRWRISEKFSIISWASLMQIYFCCEVRFGAALEPGYFLLDLLLEGLLGFGLRASGHDFARSRKIAVYVVDRLAKAVGKDGIDLNDGGGDIFQEVAVVRDDEKSELGGFEEGFEPEDAFEIEVIGGLV